MESTSYIRRDSVSKKKNIKIICYINGFTSLHSFDFPVQADFFDYLKNLDFYFIPEKDHAYKLNNLGINAHYVPFFVDPFKYRSVKIPKFFDALFVGEVNENWANNRRIFLQEVSKKARTLIVSMSKSNIKEAINIRNIKYENIVNLLHSSSNIVFGSDYLPSVEPYNKHILDPIIPYASNLKYTIRARMFTVLGSAAAYVVEDHKSVTELFEKNHEILTWSNLDELINIIKISKSNDKFIQKIGLNGRKKVIHKHTIFNRLSLFEKLMNDRIFKDFPKIID